MLIRPRVFVFTLCVSAPPRDNSHFLQSGRINRSRSKLPVDFLFYFPPRRRFGRGLDWGLGRGRLAGAAGDALSDLAELAEEADSSD